MNKNILLVPVILAGGGGNRLWPLSREHYAKQFLALDGEPTLLQTSLARLNKDCFAKNSVQLSAPLIICNAEHRFLVAINERGSLLGGLFYEVEPEEHSAHMDKVVVAEAFTGRGIARVLIEELCNRLRTAGYRTLTTGFFRPQFFYRLGFTIERRYAGLVRSLTDDGNEA